MEKQELFDTYLSILNEELVVAFGCTEPIAIAYAAAVAREYLGEFPERMNVNASGNIIKNVKSVVVPNSGGLHGIEMSALMGVVCGDPSKKLEVIKEATDEDRAKVRELYNKKFCSVHVCNTKASLKVELTVYKGDHYVSITILHVHTNITKIEKNGEILFESKCSESNFNESLTDHSVLALPDIVRFANEVELSRVSELIERQIDLNLAIANEGIAHNWGARVGKTISLDATDLFTKAKAMAAAGSDARMGGCSVPVVVNSGSGNQGITASVPVIVYAQEKQIPKERLIRGLLISNLVAVMIKSSMSRLSAFCGAVSASCGTAAAFTYLAGGSLQQIADAVINLLGNVSGIICDGAKSSCAAKIAASLDAAILGHKLAMQGLAFHGGDGIIKDTINQTLRAVSRLEGEGMKQTDAVVLDIMTSE